MELDLHRSPSKTLYGTMNEDQSSSSDVPFPNMDHSEDSFKAYLYILTTCSAIGGFLFGYDTGVISGALVLIRNPKEFDLTDLQGGGVVSSAIAGAIVGSACGGFLNRRYGRRIVILISAAIFTIGALLMGVALDFSVLIFGRTLEGIAIGLSSMTIPMYISEAAPPHLRGRLVTINTLFITGGQFFASVISGMFCEVPNGWRYMVGLAMFPAILQFIGFIFLPESPRWLVSQGKENEAREILQRIRGTRNVNGEFRVIEDDVKSVKSDISFWKELESSAIRRALILGCALQALQQLAGINTVMYYSATILQMAGFTNDRDALWLSAVVSFSNFLFSVVGMYWIDRIGRRLLTLFSLFGVILTLILLGASFFYAESNSLSVVGTGRCAYSTCMDCIADGHCGYCGNMGFCSEGNVSVVFNSTCSIDTWSFKSCPHESHYPAWCIVASLFLYLACFAPGLGTTPWTINSEIYPLHVRSTALSIATSVNWICNLLVSFTFISLTKFLSTFGIFWMYAIIASVGFIWLYYHLPETKGLRLEDIQELFQNTKGRKWKGYRPVIDHIDD